tara:strand:- start:791 stop:1498 length:708 start_codon:yes stop_codon:yes gene_type:complete
MSYQATQLQLEINELSKFGYGLDNIRKALEDPMVKQLPPQQRKQAALDKLHQERLKRSSWLDPNAPAPTVAPTVASSSTTAKRDRKMFQKEDPDSGKNVAQKTNRDWDALSQGKIINETKIQEEKLKKCITRKLKELADLEKEGQEEEEEEEEEEEDDGGSGEQQQEEAMEVVSEGGGKRKSRKRKTRKRKTRKRKTRKRKPRKRKPRKRKTRKRKPRKRNKRVKRRKKTRKRRR